MWKHLIGARQAGDDIACWISKATNTHSKYVILIAFPMQQWLHECAATLHLYAHCLSC
jgi:hypothetical protein